MHGLDPSKAVHEISPREGEFSLREEDILSVIDREGDKIALVLFSGIQYFTGQLFPMEKITAKAHEKVGTKYEGFKEKQIGCYSIE